MRLSKKGVIILAAFIVAALGVFIWQSRPQEREQVYEGKTLSEWVVLLDSQTEHKAQNEAAERAFQAMGKKAMPGLIRLLHKRADPPLVAKAKALAVRFHLLRPPELQLPEFQYRAARACCVLGGWSDVDIRAAIPDLASLHPGCSGASRTPTPRCADGQLNCSATTLHSRKWGRR